MRRWILGLAVALVSAGAAAADDKAVAVVKKAIQAHGGADTLDKYKAGRFKLTGDIVIAETEVEFSGSVAYHLPDRFRLTMSGMYMGEKLLIEQVVNGDKIRNTVRLGDMDISPNGEDDKEEVKFGVVLQEAEQLTPLLDAKKFTLKAADDADVDGKKAAVVVAQPSAVKREIKMYFDKESGLLVKTANRGRITGDDGQSKEVDEETYGSGYKAVNGMQVPTKLVINHDGKKFMSMELTDIEVLEKIGAREFTTDD